MKNTSQTPLIKSGKDSDKEIKTIKNEKVKSFMFKN